MEPITIENRNRLICKIIRRITYAVIFNSQGVREDDNDWTQEWDDLTHIVQTVAFDGGLDASHITTLTEADAYKRAIARQALKITMQEITPTEAQVRDAADSAYLEWYGENREEIRKGSADHKIVLTAQIKELTTRWNELTKRADNLRDRYPKNAGAMSLEERGELAGIYEQMSWMDEAVRDLQKQLND